MKKGYSCRRLQLLVPGLFLALFLLMGSNVCWADEGEFALSVSTGTGYVMGNTQKAEAPEESFSMRHPFMMDFDLQYEVLGWLAVSAKAGVTVEDGPVLRLLPSVVFDTDDLLGRIVEIYGRVGPSVMLDPALYGVGVGGGVHLFATQHLSFLVELSVEPVFGEDSTMLIPVLMFIGIRGNV